MSLVLSWVWLTRLCSVRTTKKTPRTYSYSLWAEEGGREREEERKRKEDHAHTTKKRKKAKKQIIGKSTDDFHKDSGWWGI